MKDTIAAISTPRGFGGIGVVRISGPAALEISNKVFSKKIEEPNHVYIGSVIDTEINAPLDTCVAIFFKSPNSYTGEDVVELQMHGGIKNLEMVLKSILGLGARAAERGEFTKRAVLNGKMDLIQAQAVIELIEAKTEKALELSSKRLFGELSRDFLKLREKIIGILSQVEASVDFPFDVEPLDSRIVKAEISELISGIQKILSLYSTGRKLQNGFSIVISGKPNVGKSTLLNALLHYERAIVSEVPGTTRDTIEEMIDFEGIPVRIIDTAGFREVHDNLEKIGIERTLKAINESDLVLFVFDASEEMSKEDRNLIELTNGKKRLIVVNKTDLPQKLDMNSVKKLFPNEEIVEISALLQQGIRELESLIYIKIVGEELDSPMITTEREKNILESVLGHLNSALDVSEDSLIIEELREAVEDMGALSSPNTSEEILKQIFEHFCIGK